MINKVKFKVIGNSTYPINMLSKRGVNLRNVRFCDGYIEFTIDAVHLVDCEKYLNEFKRKYTIKSMKGIGFFVNQLRKRAGIIAGAIIFILVSVFYSLTILTVNISGNSIVSTETIQKKVAETINPPLFNAKIDKRRLEKSINSIDGISSVSVSKSGTAINITVLEELPLTDMDDIKASYKAVVSKYDSLITRIVVTNGTPLVKAGQAVKKGQELIAPYLFSDENSTVMCKAGGEVYGRVWLTKTQYYDNQIIEFSRTGKEYVYYDIKPFNWLSSKKNVPFTYYDEKKEVIFLGGIAPLKAIKYTYYETEQIYVDFDFDSQSDLLIKELSDKLEEEIPQGAEVLRNWYEVKRLDKKVHLVIYYEIETLIV